MEDRAGAESPQHGHNLLHALVADAGALVLFLAEGLDLMETGEAVLQLRVQLAHDLLRGAEERAHDLGENDAGDQDQRDREAGDQRQLPVDGQQDHEHADKCDEVRDDVRDHVRVEEFKISRVVDDAAHQIAGLLVVEEAQVQALQLVVQAASKVAHEVPRRPVCKVVAQEAEQHTEQVQPQKQECQLPDGGEGRLVDALLHDPGHGGQHLRRGQVDERQSEGG